MSAGTRDLAFNPGLETIATAASHATDSHLQITLIAGTTTITERMQNGAVSHALLSRKTPRAAGNSGQRLPHTNRPSVCY